MKNPVIIALLSGVLVAVIAGIIVVANLASQAHFDSLRAVCVQQGYSDCTSMNHDQLADFDGGNQ